MRFSPLEGIVAAALLPMHPDGSIDWVSLRRYIAGIAAAAPAAIAMNMDASEGHSLSRDEQIAVIRACKEVLAGACPLLSGLIAGETGEAEDLARRLRDAGADGLALFPVFPAFVGEPIEPEMIHAYFKAVADAGDCPVLGFRMRTMANWSFEVLSALASIPQFTGYKDSTYLLTEIGQSFDALRRLDRRITFLTGNDPMILEAMMLGCDGAFIGFAGTATAELVAMHRAVKAGALDRAREIWERLGPLARFCWSTPLRNYRPRMKELLVMEGKFACATVRLPQTGIGTADRATLRDLAERAGLLAARRLAQ